jgi:hypothetical protein
MTDDPDLAGKAIAEKTAGKVQDKVGHAKRSANRLFSTPPDSWPFGSCEPSRTSI